MTKGSAEKFYKGREKKGGGRTRVRLKKMEAKYVKNKKAKNSFFPVWLSFSSERVAEGRQRAGSNRAQSDGLQAEF